MTTFIEGVEELRAKLTAMKTTKAKAAIRKGTRAGCKIIAAKARDLAPVKTGALRRAIKVRALGRNKKKWVGTQVKMAVAYGAVVEFGGRRVKGQHFLERAAAAVKQQALDTTLETIREGIG